MRKTIIFLGLFVVCAVGFLGFLNPQAEAAEPLIITLGQATWHSDLQKAQALSKSTGKPLLQFDMIGRLDEKWC